MSTDMLRRLTNCRLLLLLYATTEVNGTKAWYRSPLCQLARKLTGAADSTDSGECTAFDNFRQYLWWRWLQTVHSYYRQHTQYLLYPLLPLNATIITLSLFVNAVTTFNYLLVHPLLETEILWWEFCIVMLFTDILFSFSSYSAKQ